MKKNITDYFKSMSKLEVTEYLILAAISIVIPWSWELALNLFTPLVFVVTVRIIYNKHVGNPSLSKLNRWALYMMMGFYLWQGVTLLWSSNLDYGWGFMKNRLPLLIMPLLLLCANTSYITPLRRRGILYAFTASLMIKFLVRVIILIIEGKKFKFGGFFDTVHHTYMALYLVMALGFLYSEWANHRDKMPQGQKIGLGVAALVLLLYDLAVSSRVGEIGAIIIFLCIVLHQIVRLRNRKLGLIILSGGLATICITYFAVPENDRRITKTVENIQTTRSDERIDIYECSVRAAINNLPFGVGIGDSLDELEIYYSKEGRDWTELNTHNIFLDSLLALGLPGLLLLLAMFTLPAVDGYRRRDFELLTLMLTIAICGMFESILSRQMGLMFIVPMWYAIASSSPCLQTDSKDSQ